jgi:circadian clock protein KaiC
MPGSSSVTILSQDNNLQLHSRSHRVELLQQLAIDYSVEWRRLLVMKMLGIRSRKGFDDFTIQKGGLAIYLRLIAAEHHKAFVQDIASSGN